MGVNALFESLAEETSARASRIDCSVGEYQSGLKTIIETLETDLRASREMSGEQEEDTELEDLEDLEADD